MRRLVTSVLFLTLLITTVDAADLPRGRWTQVGSTSFYSALWKGTGAETLLNGTPTVPGRVLRYTLGAASTEGYFADSGGGAYDSDRNMFVMLPSTGHFEAGTNAVNEVSIATGVWNPTGRPVDPTVGLFQPVGVFWPNTGIAPSGNLDAPDYVVDLANTYPRHVLPANSSGLNAYPLPRQQYGSVVYMPSVRKFFLWSGFGYWQASKGGARIIFEYDPVATKYQLIDSEGVPAVSDASEVGAAWDSTKQRVLISTGSQLWAYNPTGRPSSRMALLLNDQTGASDPGHLVYDAKRKRALKFGGNLQRYYDFDGSGNVIGGVSHRFTIRGIGTCVLSGAGRLVRPRGRPLRPLPRR